jgi:hypothetical protein
VTIIERLMPDTLNDRAKQAIEYRRRIRQRALELKRETVKGELSAGLQRGDEPFVDQAAGEILPADVDYKFWLNEATAQLDIDILF